MRGGLLRSVCPINLRLQSYYGPFPCGRTEPKITFKERGEKDFVFPRSNADEWGKEEIRVNRHSKF